MRPGVVPLAFLICVLIAATAESAEGSGLAIIRGGQAQAVIVISLDADDQTRKAANVLSEYLWRSTEARVPVVIDRPEGEEYPIFVGGSALSADPQIAVALQDLDEQGFVIQCRNDHIAIVGPSAWGTLHGVYEFLERYVGVRWLLPGPDGEDVPLHCDVIVPWGEIREEPAFSYRTISPIRGLPDSPGIRQWHNEWAQRNKLQGNYNDRIRFHHNLHSVFPPEKYGKTHCELYPDCRVPGPRQNTGWQPCFTEKESVDIAVAEIIAYFASHPYETGFSLGVNDSRDHCEANPTHPHYPGRLNSIGMVDMSDIYYFWVNQVVTRVLEVYPDKWFGLLAYCEVMDPPSFPLHPRVVPFITKDRMAWIDDDVQAAGHKQMDAWNAVAAQIAWYDYMYGGVHYVVPRIFNHVMAENFRYAKRHGVVGTYTEMYHTVIDGPKPWLAARLQWNPDQDVDALLWEWYERAVGPAAAHDLKAFYDLWEHFWTERIKESPWFARSKGRTYLLFTDLEYLHLVTDEDIRESTRLLASVVAKAKTPEQKARAELIRRAFEYCEASVNSYPRRTSSPQDRSAVLRMLGDVARTLEERLRAAQSRYELMDEFRTHPLLRAPSESRIHAWGGWPAEEFFHLVDYLKAHESEGGPVTEQLESMAQSSSRRLRAFAELLLQIRDGTPSLTGAKSFEDPFETNRRWSKWIVSTGDIRRVEDVAYRGRASLLIEGMARGGPHQTFNVQPGLAAVSVRYYVPSGNTEGTIQLTLHLKDAQGANLVSYRSNPVDLSSHAGEWSGLGLLEEMPGYVDGQRVVRAQLVVTVDGALNTPVYVDEVLVCHSKTPVPVSDYEQFIEFVHLGSDAHSRGIRGMLDAQVSLPLVDTADMERVEIRLDDSPIYTGARLPGTGELMIDTRDLSDGRHEITVRIVVDEIGTLEKSEVFVTRNYWTLHDPFEPPIELGWFGTMDRSKTSEQSDGWQYSTERSEAFWGDADRKTRAENTTEFLVWETPGLREYCISLYAKRPDISGLVDVAVSLDGSSWDSLPYTITDTGRSSEGWHRLVIGGEISIPIDRRRWRLRLQIRESREYEEIHLGEAEFRGLDE
ncbi:MAG: DUF4838 domain-containing protein [Limnochordia bacterium]|jgi:hypothetical protein